MMVTDWTQPTLFLGVGGYSFAGKDSFADALVEYDEFDKAVHVSGITAVSDYVEPMGAG